MLAPIFIIYSSLVPSNISSSLARNAWTQNQSTSKTSINFLLYMLHV